MTAQPCAWAYAVGKWTAIIAISTGRVRYVLWIERRLPSRPGAGSGSRPASFARTSFQWPGMITKRTFAAMIVPSMAPSCRSVPRPEKTWLMPQAVSVSTASPTPASQSVVAFERPAERLVDDVAAGEQRDAQPGRLAAADVGDAGSTR